MGLILVINSGSSNVKIALFQQKDLACLWQKHVDGQKESLEDWKAILSFQTEKPIIAIGHRVVHGGHNFIETTLINEEVKKHIQALFSFAPLHNKLNLSAIESCEQFFPKIPQFAIFDTAFHHTMDEVATTYPIPWRYKEEHIRRYGFHGISFSYCSKQCASFLNSSLDDLKVIICHLGSGASLCALKRGMSVDTTMGMTPLEGLMMATRSGSIDPGILIYLMKERKIDIAQLDQELNHESGLLGVSGLGSDIRAIEHACEQGDKRAQLALAMFIHRLRGCIGQMIATLGGLDILVFTGGIGENSSWIRQEACASFNFLGLEIDEAKNNVSVKQNREISSSYSKIKVLVLPTNEELEIAQECQKKISTQ